MANILDELKYTKEHEWLRLEGDIATIGITDHAQSELGDVVFVELPDVGDTFSKGDEFGVVESVKTVSNLYAPICGEITAINESLDGDAELVNKDSYGLGWLIKIKIADSEELAELLNSSSYAKGIE